MHRKRMWLPTKNLSKNWSIGRRLCLNTVIEKHLIKDVHYLE